MPRVLSHLHYDSPLVAGDHDRVAGEAPPSRRRRTFAGAAVLVLVIAAAYLRTFEVPFLFDDVPSITENPTIRNLRAIGEVLSPPRDTGRTVNGRPALNLSLAVNYALGGESVRGYHFVNLLIHLCATLTLYGIVRRTLGAVQIPPPFRSRATALAFLTALTWGAHPLHTSAVTYIVQRAESMMGLCYLFTLYCVIRSAVSPRRPLWSILAVLTCTVGMATKETMVTAPLIAALYDRQFLAHSWGDVWRSRRWMHIGLGATSIILIGLVASGDGRGGTAGWETGMGAWQYALVQANAILRYVHLAFWPLSLVFDYGTTWAVAPVPTFAKAGVIIFALLATVAALRRRAAVGFLGAWFFIILAPSSSLLPVATQVIAEHRMYLPLAALCAASVLGATALLGSRGVTLGMAAGVGLGIATWARNETFRDAAGLWRDTVAKLPANARAHYNYALLAAEGGREQEAIAHYREVIRLQPRDAETHNKIAAALLREGRTDEATTHLAEALRIRPSYADAHNNLGVALARTGQLSLALEHFEAVARLRPASFEANFNHGNVLAQLGRRAEAIVAYEKAKAIRPENAGVVEMLDRLRRD